MKLSVMDLQGQKVYYRKGSTEEGSSDEHALKEVVERRAYRRVRFDFDVMPGENWLDLGANIGSFAIYCKIRGATAECYEPEPECFSILEKNAKGFELHNMAVTALKEDHLQFYSSKNPDNNYRGTIVPVSTYQDSGSVANLWAGDLPQKKYDGVKMDIEGSEGAIIDEWLLPPCEKLCMEYHTSRDSSVASLKRRLEILGDHFREVKYPYEYNRAIIQGLEIYRPRFDHLIFARDPK